MRRLMCDWRGGERTFLAHMRWCYPKTSLYLCVMVTLILIVTVLDLWREWL